MPPARPAPPGSPQAISVARFAADLRRRVLGQRFRHVKALAAHAETIGVGRSTIYSALGGQYLPSEYTLRRLLAVATDMSEDELRRWVAARAELEQEARPSRRETPPPDGPPPGEPTIGEDREPGPTRHGGHERRRWSRAGWAVGAGLGAALLVLGLERLAPGVGSGPTPVTAPTAGPATTSTAPLTPGVHCIYGITDPGGADVYDYPSRDAKTYGPRRPSGQLVQSRRPCTSSTDENSVTNNDTRWVQVIVGGPATNINGWIDRAQLDIVSDL